MKKLLLSSLMMFAVCGYVTAQNATGSKLQKSSTTTTSAAPTPQKAAVVNNEESIKPDAKPASDKAAQAAAPAPTGKGAKVKPAEAVTADGVVAPSNDELTPKERDELKKMEAAKAANAKKNN